MEEERHYKTDFYTEDVVIYIADEGWHFESLDGMIYGSVVYDSPMIKFNKYYQVVQDKPEDL